MAYKATYARFLSSPSAAVLANDASLNYITTLTTLNEPSKIIRNLTSLELKRKEQKIISAVEDPEQASLAVEVDTTIEFVSSGGAYLPGLDDNFLADRVVKLPIIHFVHFDGNGKIQQIRLHWDQGSLLKHIEVIGTRGRNWPIQDGPDQVRLIKTSSALVGKKELKSTGPTTANRGADDVAITSRAPAANGNNSNVTRDPHASLALFVPRDQNQDSSYPAPVAPRASAKPPQRDYQDLFAGGYDSSENRTPKPKSSHGYQQSVDSVTMAPKGGAGKNYQPSRLFDDSDVSTPPPSAMKPNPTKYKHFSLGQGAENAPEVASPFKVSPKKYNHFEFGDGSDPTDKPIHSNGIPGKSTKTSNKHNSQWNFEDFSTPAKAGNKVRGQDVRHFGFSDADEDTVTPGPKQDLKPRRDAEPHFEFQDDGTPSGERRPIGPPRGTGHNSGLGLYSNNVYDEDGDGKTAAEKDAKRIQPLSSMTTNASGHRKVFDSQFSMTDSSPASAKHAEKDKINTEDRQKAVNMMNASWDSYDQSPLAEAKKENQNVGIKANGDGMGGRKGPGGRGWGIGDLSDGEEADIHRGQGKGRRYAGKQVGVDEWNF